MRRLALLGFLLAVAAAGQEPGAPAAGALPVQEPPPRTEYQGRRIARTMHWSGAPWLLRATREDEEQTSLLYRALAVQPGWTVADVGCGAGYHVPELARRAGPGGRVFAVDIQEEMLARMQERVAEAGLRNVVSVRNRPWDAGLPEASCDLILLVDVYHEFSHPERMLRSLRRALASGGVLVLVEFRAEDPEVPIQALHKMSAEQCRRELEANGFRLIRAFEGLPWQHCLFFSAAPGRSGAGS